MRMNIRGIPALLLIKDGRVVDQIQPGSEKQMLAQIERSL